MTKESLVALRRSPTHRCCRVFLLSVDWHRPGDPRVPLGHASLHASLLKAGVSVEAVTIEANNEDSVKLFVDRVFEHQPDILGIGLYAWNESVVRRLITKLRPRFSGEIVLGGPQVTYQQPTTLLADYPEADTFVRGAGEHALVQLARSNQGPLDGVIRRNGPSSGAFASAALSELPSPLLTPGVLGIDQAAPMVRWETARGCAFRCAFCAHDTAPGMRKVDRIDVRRLADEAELVAAREVRRVNVLDPLFNANRGHAACVLDALSGAGFSGELTAQMHFGAMKPQHDNEWMEMFALVNVDLEFGLQTGDPFVAEKCGRKLDRVNVERVVTLLRDSRVRFMVTLIYGLPYQTLSLFKETLSWCDDIGIERVRCYPLSLLVGTPFYALRSELGFREGRTSATGDVPVVVETPWMSAHEMSQAQQVASIAEQRQALLP